MSLKTPPNQNPKSEIQNPKSEIQNPKSKIRNPKSKIQNPKSKIQNPKFAQEELLHKAPKSKIQFSDSALRSEARIPPGPSLGGGGEPTVSDTVGERKGTWWWKREEKQVKPIFFHVFLVFTCTFGLFMSGGPSLAASLRVTKTNCI